MMTIKQGHKAQYKLDRKYLYFYSAISCMFYSRKSPKANGPKNAMYRNKFLLQLQSLGRSRSISGCRLWGLQFVVNGPGDHTTTLECQHQLRYFRYKALVLFIPGISEIPRTPGHIVMNELIEWDWTIKRLFFITCK